MSYFLFNLTPYWLVFVYYTNFRGDVKKKDKPKAGFEPTISSLDCEAPYPWVTWAESFGNLNLYKLLF